MQENNKECEVVLNSYEEIRHSKEIFDEILEGMTHGTSSSGVGRMPGMGVPCFRK